MKARRDLTAIEIGQVRGSIQRRLGDTSVPTLPQVAVRIIELVSNPDSAISDFTEVIQADQALTGRLLRMANSAAFAQRQSVTRVERAMVLLGLDRLKALALGFHLSQAAAKGESDAALKSVWTQSLFRGWLALRLAEKYSRASAGECFIVGLLSDVGRPMMRKLVGSSYDGMIHSGDAPGKQYLDETMKLPFTHADVAAALCEMWKLPQALAWPIANHHMLPSGVDWKDAKSSSHTIGCFVGAIPLNPAGKPISTEIFGKLARRLLRVDAREILPLIDQAGEDFEACKLMFSHIVDADMTVDQIVDQANRHMVAEEDEAAERREQAKAAMPTGGEILRYEVDGLWFELEAAGGAAVMVYIADGEGNRLLSERVQPENQPEEEIRSLLLLETSANDDVGHVIDGIRRLAA